MSTSSQEGAEGAVPVMDLAQVCLPSTGQAAGGLVQVSRKYMVTPCSPANRAHGAQ